MKGCLNNYGVLTASCKIAFKCQYFKPNFNTIWMKQSERRKICVKASVIKVS